MEKRSSRSFGFRFGCNRINQCFFLKFFFLIYIEEKGIWRRGMVLCDEKEKRKLLGRGTVIEERWVVGTVTEERRYKEEREINIFLTEKREATNKLIYRAL